MTYLSYLMMFAAGMMASAATTTKHQYWKDWRFYTALGAVLLGYYAGVIA